MILNNYYYNKTKNKSGAGFTLIELMVVIAIIGLLVAVIMPSFYAARKESRVAKRISDMKQVQAALEFYYSVNRSYPSVSSVKGLCPIGNTSTANGVIPGLAPTYIPAVPVDPQSDPNSNNNCYMYMSDGTGYVFLDNNVGELFATEDKPNYLSYPELIDPARDGGDNNSIVDGDNPTAWKISSPQPEWISW